MDWGNPTDRSTQQSPSSKTWWLAGETHRYIGDEIVVTWPFSAAIKNACCLQCVIDIQLVIEAKESRYNSKFGVVPRFRAGLHGGSIVASEVGDDKREIVYFGDTINTAARLQSLCKQKNKDFLVSGELLDTMTLPSQIKAQYIGEEMLRGKTRSVEVFALSRHN